MHGSKKNVTQDTLHITHYALYREIARSQRGASYARALQMSVSAILFSSAWV